MRKKTPRNNFYLVNFEGTLTPIASHEAATSLPVDTDAAECP